MKLGLDWPCSFREEYFLKIMVMYMYIAPGPGQTTPGVNFFSFTVLFSQYSPLL